MDAVTQAKAKIRGKRLKLVMPEGMNPRIRNAAELLRSEDLADPIVFDELVPEPTEAAVAAVLARREKMDESLTRRLLKKPLFAGAALMASGDA